MQSEFSAEQWISALHLLPHPEGGFYSEVYRANTNIPHSALPPHYSGSRSLATSIYFLLKSNQRSHFHRLRSDELWYFHAGSAIVVHVIAPNGTLTTITLGTEVDDGQQLCCIIPAEHWFSAIVEEEHSYGLVSCVVAPGFDFADFELAERKNFAVLFPQHKELIFSFTKE